MTTVGELFEAAGVVHAGSVPWESSVPLDSPGVYAVALSESPLAETGRASAPLDRNRIEELLRARPEAMVDHRPADAVRIADRLGKMWVPGEPVVYIGLAGASVRRRIEQFYRTEIGARAPHAGGWPVKMIDQVAAPLWVHYGATAASDRAEVEMVSRFVAGVSKQAAENLVDPGAPLPFANLAFPHGRRKRHGISGVKEPRAGMSVPGDRATRTAASADALVGDSTRTIGRRRSTQNVTAKDVATGQLRIPGVSKDVFPQERGNVVVCVAGERHSVRWDPRMEGNRSGVLRLGVDLMRAHLNQAVNM